MTTIYIASDFPILQNRVYSSKDEAVNCQKGNLHIMMDENGFVSNLDFDSQKMEYDSEYDNSVPSDFFKQYYAKIGSYLTKKYNLDSNSLVLDIGCGKGTFLKQMFDELAYEGSGIGIDPSYEGSESLYEGKLSFIKEYFNDEHLKEINNVSLVLLRHTLEHIPNPGEFLTTLFAIFKRKNLTEVPIFIEVPDIDWIFENRTYWDFFYEHVNYFSKSSLSQCIAESNGVITEIKNDFGDQYIWAEALINSSKNKSIKISHSNEPVDFVEEININSQKIRKAIPENSSLVIWGMASKGIIYTMHLNCHGISPKYFIDVNVNKQNKFIPSLGFPISAPKALPNNENLSIICMNPNYYKEIYDECEKLGLNFNLYTPNFETIKF